MDTKHKGIDDVLTAKGGGLSKIKVLEAEEAEEFIRKCVRNTAAAVPHERRTIHLDNPKEKIIEELITLLADRGDVFRHGTELVHLQRGETVTIERIQQPVLDVYLADGAQYVAEKNGKEVEKPLPPALSKAVPVWPNLSSIPYLKALAQGPIARSDGTARTDPGYDAETQLYYAANEIKLDLPKEPSRDDARRALKVLKNLVRDFPFKTKADRAVWLAAVVTLVIRHLVAGPIPMFLVTGNAPGVGKSLLVKVAGLIAEGRLPQTMAPLSGSEREDRVRIMAIARDGRLVVLVDNVSEPIGSPALDAALTTEGLWSDRVLGSSHTASVPLIAVWFVTGNNVTIRGDLARRCLQIRIETTSEKPEERKDLRHPNLVQHVKKYRARYLQAVLTIALSYLRTKKPRQSLAPFGSYEAWSRLVRSALVWLGEPDPCETRRELALTADPRAVALPVALRELRKFAKITDGTFKAAQVLEMWKHDLAKPLEDRKYMPLWDALEDLLPGRLTNGSVPSNKALGKLLKSLSDRPAGGRRLTLVNGRGGRNSNRWKVERVTSQNAQPTSFHGTTERSDTKERENTKPQKKPTMT